MFYCFLDTNIFIHCQDIKDIDWKSELGASDVCLVIAPVVFEELDVFKDDPKNDRKRNRARRVLKFLEEILDTPDKKISEGLSLMYAEELYLMEFGAYNLNPSNKDDRLVASAMSWTHEHSEHEVILVSHDTGPRLKAKTRGLQAQALADKWRLTDQSDPRDRRIRKLEQELAKHQNSQPKLEIGFLTEDKTISRTKHVSIQFVEDLINEDHIEAAISEKFEQSKFNPDKVKFGARLDAYRQDVPYPNVTDQDIERYHNKLKKWLYSDYRNYLIEDSLFRVFQEQSLELVLAVKNSGSKPARNVEIDLEIYNCRTILEHPPTSVCYPVTSMPMVPPKSFSDMMREISLNQNWGDALWDSRRLQIEEIEMKKVDFWLKELMHHRHTELDKHYIIINKPGRFPSVVTIKYEVIAENIVSPVVGELKFIVQQSDE